MIKHIVSILAFMVVSFGVQGLSHFVINTRHFDSIGFMRADPIIPLGLLVMVIQGAVMSLALARITPDGTTVRDGLLVSVAFGLFLASYIALVEPSKYEVPSLSAWMIVEGSASFVQFVVFGVLLGFIHQRLG